MAAVVLGILCAVLFSDHSADEAPTGKADKTDWDVGLHTVPVVEVEHGEDYVIQWQDEGIEYIIRCWLGRPEGDIYHSDVWDIQYIAYRDGEGYFILEEPLGGEASFRLSYNNVGGFAGAKLAAEAVIPGTGPVNEIDWSEILGTDRHPDYQYDLPAIKSLEDLKHFDALQVLNLSLRQNDEPLTSLQGVENCPYLYQLSLSGSALAVEDLTPLLACKRLRGLWLTGNARAADLSPLKELTELSMLGVGKVETLEPITELALVMLVVCNGADGLDYSPIARIKTLQCLSIENDQRVDVDLLIALCRDLPDLTKVASSGTQVRYEHTERLEKVLPQVSIIACNDGFFME